MWMRELWCNSKKYFPNNLLFVKRQEKMHWFYLLWLHFTRRIKVVSLDINRFIMFFFWKTVSIRLHGNLDGNQKQTLRTALNFELLKCYFARKSIDASVVGFTNWGRLNENPQGDHVKNLKHTSFRLSSSNGFFFICFILCSYIITFICFFFF